MKQALLSLLLMITLVAYALDKPGRTISGLSHAEGELKAALNNKTLHNVVDQKVTLVKDSVTAIAIAEPVLFSVYGKENIINQKPYDIYHIKKYWVISGTLPVDTMGDTFLIIIDDRNGAIVRITQGK